MKEVYVSHNQRDKWPTVKFEFTEISREEIEAHFVRRDHGTGSPYTYSPSNNERNERGNISYTANTIEEAKRIVSKLEKTFTELGFELKNEI